MNCAVQKKSLKNSACTFGMSVTAKRFLSKINYIIRTDAVKKYVLPQQ
jgi:hypothetical protein